MRIASKGRCFGPCGTRRSRAGEKQMPWLLLKNPIFKNH
jgi:hypothetical protein